MPAKLTTEQFVTRAKEIHEGKGYDYENTVYLGNAKKVEVFCTTCQEVFTPLANDHLSKKVGCPSCAGVKRFNTEEFVKRAIAIHGSSYDYSKVIYVNSDTPVEIICPIHGSFFQKGNAHLQGHRCDKCSGTFKLSTEEFIKRSIAKYGDKFTYDKTNYVSNKTPLTITCKIHGDFLVSPVSHLNSSTGYNEDLANSPSTLDHFIARSLEVHGATYDYSKVVYVTNKSDVEIVCPKHGSFWQAPHNHYKGSRCAKCAAGDRESKPEVILKEALNGLALVSHDRSSGKEIDIYLPDFKVGIEINGIYWHSSDVVRSEQSHLNKLNAAKSAGIKLLQFTDADVYKNLDIIVSMVNNACNKSLKVPARSTTIKQVCYAEYTKFFKDNHISGSVPAKVCYGLYLNNELVSAMSFGTPRFTKEADWEIFRFASKLGVSVVGGASKLFTTFYKEQKPTNVISYADLRFGTGKVYERLGFCHSHNTDVGYNWHNKDGLVVSRLQSQRHKLSKLLGEKFNEALSANENMKKAGFFKIHDCGHALYKWTQLD